MLRTIWYSLCLIGLILTSGCDFQSHSGSALVNPATEFCEKNGGKVELITNPAGIISGLCVFPNGKVCDTEAFFSGKCTAAIIPMEPTAKPGYAEEYTPSPTPYAMPTITPTPVFADDGCLIYHNSELGYTFHYPSNAMITAENSTANGVKITGQMVGDEYWPVIYFNHPTDLMEYSVPYEFDLEKWLLGAGLLSGERMADTTVAGLLAIHLRHDHGSQAYDDDQYFFAHNGRLYSVVFLHTGGKKDWDFYNHFLENVQFEK